MQQTGSVRVVVADPRATLHHTVLDTPLGHLTVVARGDVLLSVTLDGTRPSSLPVELGRRDDDALTDAREQLAQYAAGDRTRFELPVHLDGSPFQELVWRGLLRIPFGSTWSYGELAGELGLDPRTSSRAVGAANGRNRLAIVVPCHRVIGADGSLTGFAAGVERKRALLDLEAAQHGGRSVLF
ncbi:methylated-DNA--[protein]-cysteine S-methyltransferase [Cellulomonas soli]|uniref:methylated-DNA--[protein]-cysteine S-methyltransferase n=1 Tax=Cellulomonas soli TaxID=931535 RepID=UPI003F86F9AE